MMLKFFIACCAIVSVNAFIPPVASGVDLTVARHDFAREATADENEVTLQDRRAVPQACVFIMGGTVLAPPALAERSLGTVTESYRRYVPRMEAGFQFLATDLKEMIESGNVQDVITEITAEKGTKISAMKGTMKVCA